MDTMTLPKEQMELKAMVPTMQSGNARVRELTPAQRRAVMFAQQQVLKAQAAKKAKDWGRADAIRAQLTEMGWSVTDTAQGPKIAKL